MSAHTRVATCASCGQDRTHKARGLCNPCWMRHRTDGTLIDFERLTWAGPELLAEWRLLEARGYTRRAAAERLGVTRDALDKAIERDRARAGAAA